ncbi:MAG: hypothetical protein J7545_09705 [Roseofilum sp. SBFL]|uniref:hypothetical protein n=1 Tax=unclassified Roseofilum TaxID=2620099 RepID=UPI001B1A4AC1|nr:MULTISPECIES: hypothetical protein [unclassified Roseofilum]MBP0013307.1 hypothetical protein [Roseofilum sp. SID3]MBP0022400.1 hypothetical protein [Roseofilum sp. SID2]MBP0037845.1 hypothetical protein [Roseofilum sp. SID1]MBP0042232.1 hypothetical protein [Roseofilum sp. SBFL]
MNSVNLRQKIILQLNQLSPDRLALVSDFIESIQALENSEPSSLRKFPPIKRGKTAADLVKFAASWEGDDLEECLNIVHKNRSPTQF